MFQKIEIVIPSEQESQVKKIFEDVHVLDLDYFRSSGSKTRFNVVIQAEQTEEVLDIIQSNFAHTDGFKIVLTPVDYFPRPPEEKKRRFPSIFDIRKERVSREEIYSSIVEMTSLNSVYLWMAVLSSLIAAIGVLNNNVAIIIASMIIAPLLGPAIGLTYGIVMGDLSLARSALKTGVVGVLIGFSIAFVLGMFLTVDLTIPAVITRTNVGQGGFVLALASGFAGALAVSSRQSSTLVGVMISISLMPPLVTFGLLLGAGDFFLAWGALLIFLVNLAAIYFAALLTFYRAGLAPLEPEKAQVAKTMAKRGLAVFFIFLVVLLIVSIFQTILWTDYVQHLPRLTSLPR